MTKQPPHKYTFEIYNGRVKIKYNGYVMFTFNQIDFLGYYFFKDDSSLYGCTLYLDRTANSRAWYYHEHILSSINYEKDRPATFEEKLSRLKEHQDYPKQVNEHNALADAKWNKRLYEFLQDIK